MAGRVAGKVALVTGAARGQGRSHAVRLAQEGADVVAVDICEDLPGRGYPGATQADLDETARLVRATGRRVVARRADVRDLGQLQAAVAAGTEAFGRLDIVSANAGIGNRPAPAHEMSADEWRLMIDVNLTGAWVTCRAAVPAVVAGGRGGCVVLTGSVASVRGFANIGHYVAAKHGLIGLMRAMAIELGPHRIRVNTVLPTQVDTPMIMNPHSWRLFRPDLENPTRADYAEASQRTGLLPSPWLDPVDVSNVLVFLASDDAAAITGTALPVDNGAVTR